MAPVTLTTAEAIKILEDLSINRSQRATYYPACFLLGFCQLFGVGTPENLESPWQLFQFANLLAGKAGYAPAVYYMGRCMEEGWGTQ